ncbi:MAG: hypothetical protein WCW65_03330 [Candidatus Paceibacterota bacterium]
MWKDEFIVVQKLVKKFEELDGSTPELKESIQSELKGLMTIIDDMSCCEDNLMLIGLKARQIVRFNKIFVK